MPGVSRTGQQCLSRVDQRCRRRIIRYFGTKLETSFPQDKPRTQFAIYADMVKRCGILADLSQARQTHSSVTKCGWGRVTFMGNLLVDMYAKCGSLVDAVKAFEDIEAPSIVSWTLIVQAIAQSGYPLRALEVFWRMLLDGTRPDLVAFVSILDICATSGKLSTAKAIHAFVQESGVEKNTVVGNVIVSMYSSCGDLASAELVFKQMPETDVISWTTMLAAYTQNGHFVKGLTLFRKMDLQGVKPNDVTFITALEAAAVSADLALGKLLHDRIRGAGFDLVSAAVSNSLINMYSKCGDLEGAKSVFQSMSSLRSAISWTAILSAYTQAGEESEALGLLKTMDLEGVKPDVVTLITAAEACSLITELLQAQRVHKRILEAGYFGSCSAIGNSLINMYGKCGSLQHARNVFYQMRIRDVVSWTTIVAVHAQGGDGFAALDFFKNMNLEGVRPNSSTFVSVLFAASHIGVLRDGRDHFLSIQTDHGVNLTLEHYAGMVDLLARAGKLSEAHELTCNMPFQPDGAVWTSVLAGCVMHDNYFAVG